MADFPASHVRLPEDNQSLSFAEGLQGARKEFCKILLLMAGSYVHPSIAVQVHSCWETVSGKTMSTVWKPTCATVAHLELDKGLAEIQG